MRLWLLRAIESAPEWTNPWDCNLGFVVRANSESEARQFADKEAADEGDGTWLNPEKTTCAEITGDGEAGVVLTDFNAG